MSFKTVKSLSSQFSHTTIAGLNAIIRDHAFQVTPIWDLENCKVDVRIKKIGHLIPHLNSSLQTVDKMYHIGRDAYAIGHTTLDLQDQEYLKRKGFHFVTVKQRTIDCDYYDSNSDYKCNYRIQQGEDAKPYERKEVADMVILEHLQIFLRAVLQENLLRRKH